MTKFTWEPSLRSPEWLFCSLGGWQCARVLQTSKTAVYYYRCHLPVYEPVGYCDTVDKAKAEVEKTIQAWLGLAGLVQQS